MKIVIDNIQFAFDKGCRLLKLKHAECPYSQLAEFWDDIVPYTFKEIAHFENMEERRVGILCLGLDKLAQEVNPELVAKDTIPKETTWINSKGELETVKFEDTYELYKVAGEYFRHKKDRRTISDVYYLQFKDTSTDRKYLLWVDISSVWRANNPKASYIPPNIKVTPTQCVAWTITTNVAQGNIEKILRQGDCIMVKPIDPTQELLAIPRHLTAEEYLTLLVAES